MVTKPKNDAEAQEMREKLNAYDDERFAEKQAEFDALMAPLREFVDSPAFQEVRKSAAELAPSYHHIDGINVHLQHLAPFMDRLAAATQGTVPIPASMNLRRPAPAVDPNSAPPE